MSMGSCTLGNKNLEEFSKKISIFDKDIMQSEEVKVFN